jgi:nucleoside permease NupC
MMVNLKNKIEKLKDGGTQVTKEVRQQMFGYIMAGFGFVAGLAWNDAIKSLIEYLFPLDKNNLAAKFLYAGVITVIIALVASSVAKISENSDAEQ